MTQTLGAGIETLRTAMVGPVISPGDVEYNDARSVWNADIDRRPAVIARCASAADVSTALGFARQHQLEVTVRGGAHGVAGNAVSDNGLMVDLSLLREITIDPVTQRAYVGGGALLADLDAAAQVHGLATPAGVVSHTGIAGLTLGGGMGWLTRKFGLAIDNLVSAEVVVADGRVLRAAAEDNADLFWAIRGGGGNFGVVTTFEFQLHEVGPIVQFGMFFWGLDQGEQALLLAREVTTALPPEINVMIAALNAPPAPFVPEQFHHQPGFALLVAGFGSPEEHSRLAARIREVLPPTFDMVTPLPYVQLQQLIDEPTAWGFHHYDKSIFTAELSDDVITVLVQHMPLKNSPRSVMLIYRLDSAFSDVAEDATAFGGTRTPQYDITLAATTPTSELLVREREWVRSLCQALPAHVVGHGSYVNTGKLNDAQVRVSYGPKYERLAAIKAVYDPENVFHRNANIRPAARG